MACSNGEHETQSVPLQNNINPHSKNLSQFLLLDTTCPVPSKKRDARRIQRLEKTETRKIKQSATQTQTQKGLHSQWGNLQSEEHMARCGGGVDGLAEQRGIQTEKTLKEKEQERENGRTVVKIMPLMSLAVDSHRCREKELEHGEIVVSQIKMSSKICETISKSLTHT